MYFNSYRFLQSTPISLYLRKSSTKLAASGMIWTKNLQFQQATPSINHSSIGILCFLTEFPAVNLHPPTSSQPESQSHHAKTLVATKSKLHRGEAFVVCVATGALHRTTLTSLAKAQFVYPVLEMVLLIEKRWNINIDSTLLIFWKT